MIICLIYAVNGIMIKASEVNMVSNSRYFKLQESFLELQANMRVIRDENAAQNAAWRALEIRRVELELEEAKTRATQLQKRLDESPYAQLESILKALVVKLPSIDLKELTFVNKEQK
jgi:hypothetical protein